MQGSVLSLMLINMYIYDIPLEQPNITDILMIWLFSNMESCGRQLKRGSPRHEHSALIPQQLVSEAQQQKDLIVSIPPKQQ